MAAIVIEPTALGNIVGVFIIDEVFDLFAVLLVILTLVFIVDFRLDIEESGSPISPSLLAVTL